MTSYKCSIVTVGLCIGIQDDNTGCIVSKIKSDKCKLSPPRIFNAPLRKFVLEFCDGGGALTRSSSSVTIMSIRFDTISALNRQTDGFAITISRSACIAC